jgi:hypothetical protein
VVWVLQAKELGTLLVWANRASAIERRAKLHLARLIVGGKRSVCLVLGCTNRDSYAPCSRCGAR